MNINPLNSFSWIENIAKENNTKPKAKAEANVPMTISSSQGVTKEKISSLKKILVESSPRENKMKEAKELISSGKIHSKEAARSAAEGMLKEESMDDWEM
ncbi:MAG: hypothetical protein HUU50_12555 [Candidatus Brocadiae bacterium]|nr:hypothetical protein [Candidatus Brocadiia bacterium]